MRQTLEFLESFVVVALFLTGLAGISYNLLRDDGWFERLFGNFWDFSVRYPLIAVPLVAGAIVLGLMWRDNRVAHGRHSSKTGATALYLMVVAGIYFAGHLLLRGSL